MTTTTNQPGAASNAKDEAVLSLVEQHIAILENWRIEPRDKVMNALVGLYKIKELLLR